MIQRRIAGEGLAAGALTLDDAQALGLVEIDGDESVIRTVFAA